MGYAFAVHSGIYCGEVAGRWRYAIARLGKKGRLFFLCFNFLQ